MVKCDGSFVLAFGEVVVVVEVLDRLMDENNNPVWMS